MIRKLVRSATTKAALTGSLLLLALSSGKVQAQWATVGPNPTISGAASYQSLAKDNAGNYYVSYYDAASGIQKGSVQKFNGTSWSYLGGQGITGSFATFNSLAVNASGEVFYAYQDAANGSKISIKKYSPVSSAWTDIGVGISTTTVNYQTLRIVPSSNQPVVSYRIGSTGVFVKRYNGTAWQDVGSTQPVVTGTVDHHSIVVGTNDTVYLAAYSGTGYTLYKSHINATTATAWEVAGGSLFVTASNSGITSAALAIDASNHVYLAYRALTAAPSLGKVCVQKYNGSTWSPVGALNISTGAVDNVSIAVTPDGKPCVAYRDAGATVANSTQVIAFDGTTWQPLGQASTQTGSYTSLILDNGYPVVAFAEGAATNSGQTVVKKYSNTILSGPDSLRVTTLGNVAPAVTSNVNTAQGVTTLQLVSTIYPSGSSQSSNWSILPGGTATGTVDATGLLTVPAQTSGILWVKATAASHATISDSIRIQVYCKPANTNPINWFIFDTVRIAGTTLNHPSSGLGNANAYRFFPEAATTTGNITAGNTHRLESNVGFGTAPQGYTYSYSMWIDYNRNGIFDNDEWTEVTADTAATYVTKSFVVPATATPGKTLMRVRIRLAGGANGSTSACTGNVGSGQMQDYIVNILPGAPPCTLGDPAAAPGSIGCVTFPYNGSTVTYTTVRGTDGNIWLQQNLGSDNVATSSTDALNYGDTFQWGRWADGHQQRNAATSPVPSPNDPTGLGGGTPNFYISSPNWWAGAALTDNWNAATPAAVTATSGCDPCKALGTGWHLPAETEWAAIIASEAINSPATAFSSNLKLTTAGNRNSSGTFDFVGVRGYYWSSTTSTTGGKYLYYSSAITNTSAGGLRGQGMSIRCLKAAVAPVVDSIRVRTQGNVAATITTNAGTLQMTATIYPATMNQAVTWSVVPVTGTATISTTGLVTAQTNGTVWAKAISVQDASKSDSLQINISNQVVLIDSVRVRTQGNVAATITTNAGTLQMAATVYPATANQSVNWSIIPVTGTATISATGLVSAQTNGTVWARATSVQDATKSDSLQITISNQGIDSVRIRVVGGAAPIISNVGGTRQLAADIFPATANQNVSWSLVPVTGTATINTTGLVTAQTNGTVWAKAISVTDMTKSDSLLITISNQNVGVNGMDKGQRLNVYPNPVSAVLNLSITAHHAALQLVLTDIYGKVISSKEIPANGLNAPYTLYLQSLANGVYFIRVTGEGISQSTRVIKQ
jgi:hypothetical protein